MRPTILLVIDTIRYDEGEKLRAIAGRPCRSYRNHWGVAPYTLPAMASMLTGELPELHGLWRFQRDPVRARSVGHVGRSVGSEVEATAFCGGGYARGDFFGYGRDFKAWTQAPPVYELAHATADAPLTLLHTYELHDYVTERDLNARMTMGRRVVPEELYLAREPRLQSVSMRVRRLLLARPEHRVIVTSDHGEVLKPTKFGQGHGVHLAPCEQLLHLPLLVYGPEITEDSEDDQPCLQTGIPELVMRGEIPATDAEVVWEFGPSDRPWRRSYRAGVGCLEDVAIDLMA